MDDIEDEADTIGDVEIDEDDASDAPAAKPAVSAAADAENG